MRNNFRLYLEHAHLVFLTTQYVLVLLGFGPDLYCDTIAIIWHSHCRFDVHMFARNICWCYLQFQVRPNYLLLPARFCIFRDVFTVLVRFLIHICLHILGSHILLMTNVRMRDTFMKVVFYHLIRVVLRLRISYRGGGHGQADRTAHKLSATKIKHSHWSTCHSTQL